MIRLSVVVPVYNGARTLGRALASLEGQAELDALEVIAVVQAASDGSSTILESFRGRLPLRVIDAPQSGNWMETTNIGLAAAQGEFVSMLHQDDLWMPGRAREMLGFAKRYPGAALWLHPAWFIDEDDRRIGRFGPPFGGRERLVASQAAMRMLIVQNTVALPAAMFRREAALRLGGLSRELWYTADWNLWLSLVRSGPVAWLPQPLAGFRIHAESQTVRGSRDIPDFGHQLLMPLELHIDAIASNDRHEVRRLAEAAAHLNLSLASRFHARPLPLAPLLRELLALGPHRWPSLLRRSQIVARVLPRLRLLVASRRRIDKAPPQG